MPSVSKKRQITIPVDQCKMAGIEPGDEYESFVDEYRHFTIVNKSAGADKETQKGIVVDTRAQIKNNHQSKN
jgi:bifunctional DNA-binding transcriptional regulator/antitoxin component of YhaV-PrlF toxin-antitoxin module